jgi:transposase
MQRILRDARPIVYLDETGFAPGAHRTHGRAVRGAKVHGQWSAFQRPRTSLIGAYGAGKLIAPMLFEGCCNAQVFNTWLEQQLLPSLPCGSVIIMDNATFHKTPKTRQLVDDAGCEILYLPPYSPDLNPIEKLWANLKRRRSYQPNLSIDDLIRSSRY